MGLIKSAISSVGGTLHEQWEDYITCSDFDFDNMLMVKKTTKTGQISARSRIQVNPGQCAIIMDSGKILDATAEEGIYTFDASTSPTLFAGQFGPMFKEMWERFTYNGIPAKEQAVYYINITEVKNNLFGSDGPIPFQDWSHPIPNQMTGTVSPLSIEIKCHGKYTFTISDPMTFVRNVGTRESYTREEFTEQMRSEIAGELNSIIKTLGSTDYKVPFAELNSVSNVAVIRDILAKQPSSASFANRGVKLIGLVIEGAVPTDDSNDKISNYELSSNSFMQQGTLTGAYANAVQDAAKNEGGAMNGFMGIGMMNMASGGIIGGAAQNPFNNNGQQNNSFKQMDDPFAGPKNNVANVSNQSASQTVENVSEQSTDAKRFCANCGAEVTGKFCTQCGTKYEEPVKEENIAKKCSKCGAEVTGKFCSECGTSIE